MAGWIQSYFGLIYQFYGLAFVVLGVVLVLMPRNPQMLRIAPEIPWLAAFGLLHGVLEFVDGQRLVYPSPTLTQIANTLLTLSFACLFEFGRRCWNLCDLPLRFNAYISYAVILLLSLAALLMAESLENGLVFASRYFLGATGAFISAIAMVASLDIDESDQAASVLNGWFHVAAVVLLCYGILTIFVPAADTGLPGWVPTTSAFLNATGIPVQIPRMLCAASLALALFMISARSSLIFQQNFERIAKSMNGFVYRAWHDDDRQVFFAVGGIARIAGHSSLDIEKHPISLNLLLLDTDLADVKRELNKAILKHEPFHLNYRMLDTEGHIIWVTDVGQGVYDGLGRLRYIEGQISDISAVKEAELRIADRDARLSNLAQNSPDHILLLSRYGDIEFANRALPGLNIEQTLGRHLQELIDDPNGELEHAIETSLDDGQQQYFESQMLNGRGETQLFESRLCAYQNDGQASKLLLTLSDITERRKTERSLKYSQALYHSLVESLPLSVYRVDIEGELTFANKSFLQTMQVPHDTVIGKTAYDLFPGDIAKQFRETDMQVIRNKTLLHTVEEFRESSDAESRFFEIFKFPIYTSDGAVDGIQGLFWDITERRKAEEQIKLAATVFSHAREGIVISDSRNRIIDVNHTFTDITGFTHEEVLGQDPGFLQSGRHDKAFYENMWSALELSGHWSGEIWNRKKNGQLYAEILTITAVKNEAGELTHYVGLFSDITSIKEHQSRLEHLAHYDALTNLPNRLLLRDRLATAMTHAARKQEFIALLYLDLDGFKEINDDHGHEVGDKLLSVLAGRLRASLRECDTISRLGGDEFVAVLTDLSNTDDFLPFIDRLLGAAAEPIEIESRQLQVSASIGVSFYPQAQALSADALIKQADAAMYRAKSSGKNRYSIHQLDEKKPD